MNQEKVISLCLRRWELILITSAAVNWRYDGVLTWYHRPAGTVWWARPCRPPYVRLAAPRWWACCLGLSLQAERRSPSSAPRRGWGALGCIRATGSAGAQNREGKKNYQSQEAMWEEVGIWFAVSDKLRCYKCPCVGTMGEQVGQDDFSNTHLFRTSSSTSSSSFILLLLLLVVLVDWFGNRSDHLSTNTDRCVCASLILV